MTPPTELRVNVPCGACSLCCRFRVTMVGIEEQAREHYDAEVVDAGKPYGLVWALRRNPNTDACVYLSDAGKCTIWERAPWTCKAFDCRAEYTRRDHPERRRMAKASPHWRDIFEAAKARLQPEESESDQV